MATEDSSALAIMEKIRSALDNDDAQTFSQIPDIASRCSLWVTLPEPITLLAYTFKRLSVVQYAIYRKAVSCVKYIVRKCSSAIDYSEDEIPPRHELKMAPPTLLHFACLTADNDKKKESKECIEWIVRCYQYHGNGNVNVHDQLGNTPFHIIAYLSELNAELQADICRYLLDQGADMFAPNCMLQSPLLTALLRSPDMFTFLGRYCIKEGLKDDFTKHFEEKKPEWGTRENPLSLKERIYSKGLGKVENLLKEMFNEMNPVAETQSSNVSTVVCDTNNGRVETAAKVTVSVEGSLKCVKCSVDTAADLTKCQYCDCFCCQDHKEIHEALCKQRQRL